jgi:hypothetical protein
MRRWKAVEGAQRSQKWIKPIRSWPIFAADEDSSQQFQTLGHLAKKSFIHTPCPSRIILGIALAGTGSGPGIGRAAVTSRRGFGSHDLRGRPTGRHSQAKRKCSLREGGSSARHCPWKEHGAGRVTGRPWRQTPAGRGSCATYFSFGRQGHAPRFPTSFATARAESQRGKGEVRASSFYPSGRRWIGAKRQDG